MATEIEVTFAKSQSLPDTVPEGRLQLVDESASATEVEAYVGTQNGTKKITDKDKASIEALENGDIVPKLADNMTPYAEDSGTTQTQPFFLEGTATGNGESRVDAKQVPAYAFLQEKRGNMVYVNQLVRNGNFSTTSNWMRTNSSFSVSDNVGTFTATAPNGEIYQGSIPRVKDHKYLVNVDVKLTTGGDYLKVFAGGQIGSSTSTTNWQSITVVYTSTSTVTGTVDIQDQRASGWDAVQIKNVYFVDLTQWFNGNIPAYLLSHPEAFGRYYKGSLAYEPGRLESATGRYLTSVGRNIWNEEWESGTIAASTGVKVSDANKIRSKNYISITSSTTYYVKAPSSVVIFQYDADKNYIGYIEGVANTTFTTDSTCHYIYFVCGSSVSPQTTYNHDITISEYYPGESGYDKYYPHEVLATIDTGTEPLYSAGSAYDSKVPSGLITRRIGSVDLGTLNWKMSTEKTSRFYPEDFNIKTSGKAICSRYTQSKKPWHTMDNGSLWVNTSGLNHNIWIRDDDYTDAASFKAAMSGVMLYYELAEPTTEQGTPFQENVPIDDFGQLSWSNTDVPQGNQIFYPVDYKAAIDTLIKYTDGDATSLVRKTDYASANEAGVVKVNVSYGIGISPSSSGANTLYVVGPSANEIKHAENLYRPPVVSTQHMSVFYGLSRAAGVNLASSTEETAPDGTNPGVYPATAKTAIQNMLGITDLIGDINTVLDSVNGVVI